MADANSGGPVGEGHGHIEVAEVRVDAAVAPVQAALQGNGVGPAPVLAAAGPAIVVLLQELLASQQAIAARLANVVNIPIVTRHCIIQKSEPTISTKTYTHTFFFFFTIFLIRIL